MFLFVEKGGRDGWDDTGRDHHQPPLLLLFLFIYTLCLLYITSLFIDTHTREIKQEYTGE